MAQTLEQEITVYGDISVAFNQQKVQKDKQTAFLERFQDLNSKLASLNQDIVFKMRQFLDLALQRKQTLSSARDSFAMRPSADGPAAGSQQLQEQLDVEELKLQGEIDFNEKIIQERQENLDAAEAIAVATRDIAITINQKVHE